jgi:hypothetical protein
METRVALLEQTARTIVAALERIEQRLDLGLAQADNRMERIERRLDLGLAQADNRMDRIERRLDIIEARRQGDFRWQLGVMFAGFSATLAGFGTMLGVMAHGFHWL